MSSAEKKILGIHHVTAIASNPQRNVDFYCRVLGLRLVKKTVNFDDPSTYHLYYGDGAGHPGTILTFFPWPDAPRGKRGSGQLTVTAFSIPKGSVNFWTARFKHQAVDFNSLTSHLGETVISFSDPDDLRLELVAHDEADRREGWKEGPVPKEHAIRGFYGVTLSEEGFENTVSLLTETMGFRKISEQENRYRYEVGNGGPGSFVDVICQPDAARGSTGVGTVHHVAWRTPDVEQEQTWREVIRKAGLNVTPIIDRQYFRSIYFREPGGVLFEVATDPPGFTRDETLEQLGTKLTLPPWLETSRREIEAVLPRIHVPTMVSAE